MVQFFTADFVKTKLLLTKKLEKYSVKKSITKKVNKLEECFKDNTIDITNLEREFQ